MQCKLCLQDKELQNSHIIPEFLYKSLYDKKHKIAIVPVDTDQNAKTIQTGIYEKLLCRECEQFFNSNYEQYVCSIFYGTNDISVIRETDRIIVENIDYLKFKLFALSILWRAGVANNSYFSVVDLGPHQEKIRQMLINKDPGEPHEYGCWLIETELSNGEPICTPSITRINNHQCYVFLFAGCLWIYIVSKHSKEFIHKNVFLNRDGKLSIYIKGKETEEVKKIAKEINFKGDRFLFT